MKTDYLISIIQNIVNVGSQFQFNIYDALKMDNVKMDTNKINGIARVTGGSVEPIKDLGTAQLSMEIEFIYPYERNDFVKQHLIDTATKTAGLVIQNSTIDPEMIGSTGVDIIFPTQGNYAIKNIGETMRCFIICYFDINEKSVLANDVKIDIQKGFQYNAVEVDEESEGDFYVVRNIQADDITNLVCKAEPIQPTITEYDTIGIDFVYDGNNLVADYGFVGNQKCFRVDYPETEEYYGKDFYSWNDGEVLNESYGAGWNRYKQDKEYTFGNLVTTPVMGEIYRMVKKDSKIYCCSSSVPSKFAIYDIATETFSDLITTPISGLFIGISDMIYAENKIYFGTTDGRLFTYDIETETFSGFISNPFLNKRIWSMGYFDGNIYFNIESSVGVGSFAIYNISTATFSDLIINLFGTSEIYSILGHDGNIYCAGYNGGFAIYNISTETFSSFITTPFGTSDIRSMEYFDGNIYCCGNSGKFAIYNISSGEFGDLISNPFGTSQINSMVYYNNRIYVCGNSGKFAIYNISSETFGSLISTPFGTSAINSMIYNDGKIYCGGSSGKFAIYEKQFIIETTTPPTYEDVYILYSNMWQVMSDLIEYSGADRYLELQLPQDYADNRYEEFYEKEIFWENIPYFKNIITRHRLSNTNKYMNSSEMRTINNGQSFDISLAVPSIKGSVINDIKDDLLNGDNLNKGYNLRLYDESGYKYFNEMLVSGDFEEELIPGNSVILKIMFVYKRV